MDLQNHKKINQTNMENQAVQTTPSGAKGEWLFWLIMLLPFLYLPFIWDKLPDSIPTHWNFRGEVNHYSSKTYGTLFLPLLNIGMYLLLLALPKIDPRKKNYQYFGNTYRNIRILLVLFMTTMFFVTMQMALGAMAMNSKAIFILIFGLMAALGNFMRTIRSNFFVGIRTPWTLDNPEVWRKTHEMGGKLWFYASLAGIVGLLFIGKEHISWFVIPYFSAIVIYPVLYSYLLFRKINSAKTGE
jgi:uncharacterized membrane protein